MQKFSATIQEVSQQVHSASKRQLDEAMAVDFTKRLRNKLSGFDSMHEVAKHSLADGKGFLEREKALKGKPSNPVLSK